jgi:hypothetical protein
MRMAKFGVLDSLCQMVPLRFFIICLFLYTLSSSSLRHPAAHAIDILSQL